MINFENNSEELNCLLKEFLGQKHTYNNYFGIDLDGVSFYHENDTLILSKPFETFERIYVMSNDRNVLVPILKGLSDTSVINILSRKGFDEWFDVLDAANFQIFDTFEHLVNRSFEPATSEIVEYAIASDFNEIKDKMYKYFSPLTGHLPNDKELRERINNNSILVIRENNVIAAALCYTIAKNRCELDFWFSESKHGLWLIYTIYDICQKANIKTVSHWVKQDNIRAKKIYQFLGDVHDGLVDKTFIKRTNTNK